LCNVNILTSVLQNSRKSERSGRLARRRRRTNARLTKSAPVLLRFLPKVPTVLLPQVTNKADLFSSHPLDTNPAHKFQVNTKSQPVVFNNFRNMATVVVTFNTLATQLLLTVLQTRCTVNVITPSISNTYRTMLTYIADNSTPQPKYEH
jgi:hypothetical protein